MSNYPGSINTKFGIVNPFLDEFLSKLTKVRKNGRGWTACCPAHDDRMPSMSIAENDGKITVCCFAGCGFEAITGAVGMRMEDFYPPRAASEQREKLVAGFTPLQITRMVIREAGILEIAVETLLRGNMLSVADIERVYDALRGIERVRQEVGRVNR